MPTVPPPPAKNTSRQFASQGGVLFLLRAVPAVAVLIVMVLYARWLPQTLYGQYQNFWVRYGLLSTFTTVGLPAFLLLLSPAEIAGFCRGLRVRQIGLFLVLNLLCGGLFAYWERELVPLWFSGLFLLIWTVGLLLESLLIGFRKLRRLLVVNSVFAAAFLVLHLVRTPTEPAALRQLLLMIGGLALVRTTVLTGWALQSFRKQTEQTPVRARTIWLHLTLTDLLQQAGRTLDKVLLGLLVPPARSAVYFNGAQEVPFLPALLGAASGNFLLQASADAASEDLRQKARWLRLSGTLLGALVFPLFWWLLLGRDAIYSLIFAGRYPDSVPVFAIFIWALPLRAYPFSALLQHLRLGPLLTLGALLDLVLAVVLALVLYPVMGLSGIALSFTLATVLLAFFYTWQTMRHTRLSLTELFPLKTWAVQFALAGGLGVGAFQLSQRLGWTALPSLLFSGSGLGLLTVLLLKSGLARSRALPPA